MLTVLQGSLTVDLRGELYRELARAAESAPFSFLLVPEQQTLIAESEIASLFPTSAPLYLEVTNFTRLANTVFRKVGGLAERVYDSTEKALLMWRALSDAQPMLSDQSRAEVSAGSVAKALAAVSEMAKLSIGSDEVEGMASDERLGEDKRLMGKLSDLSLLMHLFERAQGEGRHPDEITRMAERLEADPTLLANTPVFIDGFTSFTEGQYRVITLLSARSDVFVTLSLPKAGGDGFEYTELRETMERLSGCARLANTELKRRSYAAISHIKNEALGEICRGLWRSDLKIDNDCLQKLGNSLRIFLARTPYEEASFIASDIRRRVMEGASYKDFAIVARNLDPYLGILDRALVRAELPVFVSEARDVSSFEAVKLIRYAYRILEKGFRRDDVIAYAKCGLSGLARDMVDTFESYVNTWQLSGTRFTDGELWNMNPDGYTTRRSADAEDILLCVNEAKATLIPPLLHLCESVGEKMTVREHADALVRFLGEIGMEERLYARADHLLSIGEESAARDNEALWGILCDVLDKTVEVLCDFELPPRDFSSLLEIAFSSVDVGRLPPYVDQITLGSANMLRLYDKKHVYLVGVNYGEFPMSAPETSYFSEKERTRLRSLGYGAEPDADVRAAKELFFFSRAFSFGSESVTLLLTEKSTAFKNTPPASLISHLAECSGGRLAPVAIDSLGVTECVFSAESAKDYLAGHPTSEDAALIKSALTEIGEGRAVALGEGKLYNDTLTLSDECTARLYGHDLSLTQSRIDAFVGCPMQHFLHYILKVDEERRAEFDSMNIGTMVHAILEHFFYELHEGGEGDFSLPKDEIRARVERIAREHVRSIDAHTDLLPAKRAHMIDRLTRGACSVAEGLCEELAGSSYLPAFFELKIERGAEGAPEPTVIPLSDGTRAFVYGTIDRVDTYAVGEDVFVRVIDYKTGSKHFCVGDLAEGRNLQMFLYLRSLVESKSFRARLGVAPDGEVIPGGVLYVETALDAVTRSPSADGEAVLKAHQARRGMLLNEERSLSAMNRDYLPLRYTSTGALHKSSEGSLYTREGWQELCREIDDTVRRVTDEMKSGRVPSRPGTSFSQNPCTFCAYRPVCRRAKALK